MVQEDGMCKTEKTRHVRGRGKWRSDPSFLILLVHPIDDLTDSATCCLTESVVVVLWPNVRVCKTSSLSHSGHCMCLVLFYALCVFITS